MPEPHKKTRTSAAVRQIEEKATVGAKLRNLRRLPEVAEKLDPDSKPGQGTTKKQVGPRLGKMR